MKDHDDTAKKMRRSAPDDGLPSLSSMEMRTPQLSHAAVTEGLSLALADATAPPARQRPGVRTSRSGLQQPKHLSISRLITNLSDGVRRASRHRMNQEDNRNVFHGDMEDPAEDEDPRVYAVAETSLVNETQANKGETTPVKRTRRIILTALIVVMIAVVAAVVGVTLGSKNSTSQEQEAPPSSFESETSEERKNLTSFIKSKSPSTTFTDDSSPQSQALEWMLKDAYTRFNVSDEDHLLQRFALATLWYSLASHSTSESQWLTPTSECEWDNTTIVCNATTGRTTELYLNNSGYTGHFPPEIGLLTDLRELAANNCTLDGTIPHEIGDLTKLTSLAAQNNRLFGSIPTQLCKLTKLHYLDLSQNRLNSTLPTELGSLTELRSMVFYSNDLEGQLVSGLGQSMRLSTLSFSVNRLTGTLPSDLFLLTRLRSLDLEINSFQGPLSTEAGLLTGLTSLSLHFNQFSGTLISELGMSSKLIFLDLSDNKLTNSLPTEFGKLSHLHWLNFQGNQRLKGQMPTELAQLVNLKELRLGETRLSGTIPSSLCSPGVLYCVDSRRIECNCCNEFVADPCAKPNIS